VYTYFPNAQDKRLREIKNQRGVTTLISQFDYTYDAEGQILTWTRNYPGLSPAPQRFDLGYDNADQLLTAPLKNGDVLLRQYTYGYDLAANRTSELVDTTTTTSTPNNVNEITSQSGGTNRPLTYDANGSLTDDGLTRTFEWDGANRLRAINYTGTANGSEFTYDGLSRCVKIVEKTGQQVTSTRKFVWCGMERCEFRDANDAVTVFVYPQGQYSHGPYFYSRDHLGSIREMFKSNGTVVARYDYDPWGRSTAVINTTLPDFNFTGLYRHSRSNLDLAVYRAYDPDLGRWISRDPIAEQGGINLYRYIENNPVEIVDPLGLWQITVGGGAGLGFLISFGNNGGSNLFNGQWNIQGNVGLGGGLFGELDTGDSPHAPSGSTPQLRAHCELSGKIKFATGQQRGVSLAADATYDNTNGFQFEGPSFGAGLPVHAGGSADHFTLSAGAGWFVGSGVTGYQ
jgi:RHS repeat-associated protein